MNEMDERKIYTDIKQHQVGRALIIAAKFDPLLFKQFCMKRLNIAGSGR